MRGRALAAMVLGLLGPGCLPAPEHRCASDQDCGGGACVSPPGACAFADPLCGGGLRFGEGAGAQAGTCVAGTTVHDAGTDARAIDAAVRPDEDHDGVPDVEDNCPHIANPGQEDVSELTLGGPDGVGDACDPEPSKTGNRIVLFDGFATGLSPLWGASMATTTAGGHLRMDANGQLITAQALPRHVQVLLGGRGTGTLTEATFSVGVAIQANGTGVFATQTTALNSRFKLTYGTNSISETASDPIVGGTAFTLSLATARSQWTAIIQVAGNQPHTIRRQFATMLSNGWIGLANAAGPIEVDHVVVISLDEP